MNKEDYREWFIKNQFYIPKNLFYLANEFPTVTWKQAQNIYKEVVQNILNLYNTDCLLDIGAFHKGVRIAEIGFENSLREYVMRGDI